MRYGVIVFLFCLLWVGRLLLVGPMEAGPLGGVLILLGTATAKIHPAHVVPVTYPVAGVQVLQVLNDGHSPRRSYKGQGGRKQGHYI